MEIRIFGAAGQSGDLSLPVAPTARLSQLLAHLSAIAGAPLCGYFRCVDEDGDLVTVHDDNDLRQLIEYNKVVLFNCSQQGQAQQHQLQPQSPHLAPPPPPPPPPPPVVQWSVTAGAPPSASLSPISPPPMQPLSPLHRSSAGGPAPLAPEQFDYGLVIGRGQFGIVYRAVHRASGTTVAIKCINLEMDEAAQVKIISELQILADCSSPYIISYHGSFFVENTIHVCTDWMDGGSLDKYGRVPEQILGFVCRCVVDGLRYLWGKGVMHRDVKTANILVNCSGEVKLCDFGLAIQLKSSIALSYCGTSAYMSPERIMGKEYRVHSDVWSLGVTLYELATGSLPFPIGQGLSGPMLIVQAVVGGPAPRLPAGEFSPDLVDFVGACLQKEPEKRPNPTSIVTLRFYGLHTGDQRDSLSAWVRARLPDHLQAAAAS